MFTIETAKNGILWIREVKVFACLGTSVNDIELLVAWAQNLSRAPRVLVRLARDWAVTLEYALKVTVHQPVNFEVKQRNSSLCWTPLAFTVDVDVMCGCRRSVCEAGDNHDNRTEEPAAVYNLVKSGEIRFTEEPTHFVKTIWITTTVFATTLWVVV